MAGCWERLQGEKVESLEYGTEESKMESGSLRCSGLAFEVDPMNILQMCMVLLSYTSRIQLT